MSWGFNFGYPTGYFQAPPPPPPPTEITFEHAGQQHRLLVADEVLQNLLRLSAQYEAQQRARQQSARPRYAAEPTAAENLIRALSFTGDDVPLRIAVRRAKRRQHPDTGGTADRFRQVLEAEETLKRAGML